MNLIYFSLIVIVIAWLLALWFGVIAGFGWLMALILNWFGINIVWWKCSIVWFAIVVTGKLIAGFAPHNSDDSKEEKASTEEN